MTDQHTPSSNAPIFKANIGAIHCSVWAKPSPDGKTTYYTAEITRSYKDRDGQWRTSSNYNHDDLLNVGKLAERAESFIAHRKQQ